MSFQQGLSGLNAASKTLEVIGNNVANASTVGFKQSQAQFADVYATSLSGGGAGQAGIGVKVAQIAQQFTQGNVSSSNNPLDIAIKGRGFFRMSDNGSITYARNGQFQLDKTGYIINAAGHRLTGYVADAQGVLQTGAPTDLVISSADAAPQVSTEVNTVLNLDSREVVPTPLPTFDPADPATYTATTSINVFDTLGNSHLLQTFYIKTAPNTWNLQATVDGAAATFAAPSNLVFDTSGAIDTTLTTTPITVTSPALTTGAATPLVLDLSYTGTTQFGSIFGINAQNQDGFASGHLSGFSVADDGKIVGRYTNGQSKNLGQVVLGDFTNPNGLQPLGDNEWAETSMSGVALVGVAGSGSLGGFQSSAVEESNVDLTAELVNMITA
ncbi:MAG: flagellar hook protein FlgE, partial [Pseudomonadota bacterium]